MRVLAWVAMSSCLVVMLGAGCSGRQPLTINSPVLTSKGAVSEAEVLKAIERATRITQWDLMWSVSGQMTVQRTLNNHSARVTISYSATHYAIALDQTTMMDQPQSSGFSMGTPGGGAAYARPRTVHRTYNVWVQELDQHIRAQLLSIGM